MKRRTSILLTLLVWVFLITYVIVASRYCTAQKDRQLCKGIHVKILDSMQHGYITPGMVRNWLISENMKITKEELSRINTLDVERVVKKRGFVKTARAYVTLDGYLNIDITQRTPIMRVNSVNGYNFYVTEDNYILPLQKYHVTYVPVVTGYINAPFERNFVGSLDDLAKNGEKKTDKNYIFLHKLINFVKFASSDDFWNAFIVQINVLGVPGNSDDPKTGAKYNEPQVEIVPRVGNYVVKLGNLDGYEAKLSKLMSFYNKGLPYDGWESYSYINLEYQNQVVCIK